MHAPAVFGYYAAWSAYSGFRPSSIDTTGLTHVTYAFASVSPDGRVSVADPGLEEGPRGTLAELRALKRNGGSPGLRIGVSIGGWAGSGSLRALAASERGRRRLAASLAEFVERHDLNYVDLDWEFPVQGAHGDDAPVDGAGGPPILAVDSGQRPFPVRRRTAAMGVRKATPQASEAADGALVALTKSNANTADQSVSTTSVQRDDLKLTNATTEKAEAKGSVLSKERLGLDAGADSREKALLIDSAEESRSAKPASGGKLNENSGNRRTRTGAPSARLLQSPPHSVHRQSLRTVAETSVQKSQSVFTKASPVDRALEQARAIGRSLDASCGSCRLRAQAAAGRATAPRVPTQSVPVDDLDLSEDDITAPSRKESFEEMLGEARLLFGTGSIGSRGRRGPPKRPPSVASAKRSLFTRREQSQMGRPQRSSPDASFRIRHVPDDDDETGPARPGARGAFKSTESPMTDRQRLLATLARMDAQGRRPSPEQLRRIRAILENMRVPASETQWSVPEDDRRNFVALLGAIRDAIGPKRQLTVALGGTRALLEECYDVAAVASVADYVLVMAYDYARGGGVADHASALRTRKEDASGLSADAALEYLREKGVPAHKVVLGVPLYGRPFDSVVGGLRGLGGLSEAVLPSYGSAAFWGAAGWSPDAPRYRDVYADAGAEDGSVSLHWDAECAAGWAWDAARRRFVSIETPPALRAKIAWALGGSTRRAGGVFFWELSGDLPLSNPNSLRTVARTELSKLK